MKILQNFLRNILSLLNYVSRRRDLAELYTHYMHFLSCASLRERNFICLIALNKAKMKK